jgi:putative chitinase
MNFDRKTFFDHYRTVFGPLKQELVNALEFLLGRIEQDKRWPQGDTGLRQIAYALATFKWETAHTFEPINEFGGANYFNKRYGPQTKVGKVLGNTKAGDGALFHGRGYVQLTGRTNYSKAGKLTGEDLVNDPDRALVPEVAYQIAVQGMIDGWFTGRKLGQFIKDGQPPLYDDARTIINGHDQAAKIADIARRMAEALRAARDAAPQS